MYEKFLEQLESIHLENDTFASFKLTPNNCKYNNYLNVEK